MINIDELLAMYKHMLKQEDNMNNKEMSMMEKGFIGGLIALGLNTEDTGILTKEMVFMRLEKFGDK